MKNYLLFLLFVLASLPLRAQIEITAPVSRVKVYRGLAQISHTAEVSLPAGMQTLVVHGLSPRMRRESFQVKGVGHADIVHIDFQKNFLITSKDQARIQKLKERIDQLETRLTDIRAREQALKTEQGFIKQNLKLDKNAALATVQQISAYYKKRTEAIYKELFRLKKAGEPLNKELKKLRKQLNELQSNGNRETYDAVLTLSVGRAGKFRMGFTYLADGATWAPVYTVRSNGAGADLHWEYQAEIRQKTGLDWENVPVTLSSYRPRYRLILPKVSPWYLRPYSPPVYRKEVNTKKAEYAVTTMEAEPATDYAAVEQVNSTLQVEYRPSLRYTVISNNKPVLALLDSFDTPAEYTYFAAPGFDQSVYLRARVKDLNNHRLVPGRARIYFEGVYTGEVYINPGGKDTHTDLPLGIDTEITVERKEDKRFNDYNLLGNKVTQSKGYIITVTNHKKIPVHIIVKDRFPVSQDEHIKVKDTETDGKVDGKGIITWDKTVPAGQSIRLYFRFKVQYPKDMQVSGL